MQRLGKFLFSVSLAAVVALSLGSCSAMRNQVAHDRSGDFEREDYRKMLAPRALPEDAKASIPELESLVAMPEDLKMNMPIVSISVNQTVPLRDVLFELADQADIDLELDPQIRGSIIFTARHRPFDEVIGRICDMAGLHWYFDNDVLRVEMDRPFVQVYKIDYLNIVRKLKSGISTDISVVSGEGADVGSKAAVETEVESNFWEDLQENIEQLLASTDTYVALSTQADPQAQPRAAILPPTPAAAPVPLPASSLPASTPAAAATPAQPATPAPSPESGTSGMPAPAAPAQSGDARDILFSKIMPAAGEEASPVSGGVDTAAPAAVSAPAVASTPASVPVPLTSVPPGSVATAATAMALPPELNIQIPSAPSDPAVPNPAATFSMNKQSGLISVYATHRQQREIGAYLSEIRRTMTAQVLIEAKILQVDLTDEYASGIDWNDIDFTGLFTVSGTFDRPALVPSAAGNAFSATLKPGSDLTVAVDALSRFGTTRALASPRVTVLNHQAAVLNMAQNTVFFDLEADVETDSDTNISTVSVDSEAKSVPEGVMLNVLPTINLETGEISMSVRPTITRIDGTVNDPAIPLTLAVANVPNLAALLDEVSNAIPQVSVQEVDSIIKMQSGQVMVLGGLMQDRAETEEIGIPVVSDIPVVGNLFKSHTDKIEKSELVIFLRATIVPGSSLEAYDREIYKDFSKDRRPFRM